MKRSEKMISLFIIILFLISFIPSRALADEGNFLDMFTFVATTMIEEAEKPKSEEITDTETADTTDVPQTEEDIPSSDRYDDKADSAEDTKQDPDIQAAKEFMDLVYSMGQIGPEDEQAVYDAMKMYASLSDLAKEMVSEAKLRLDGAVSILSYLLIEEEKRVESEERINSVMEEMEKISLITKEDGHMLLHDSVKNLEECYALLDDTEKLVLDERLMYSEKDVYSGFLASAKETLNEWTEEYDAAVINPVLEKLNLAKNYDPSLGVLPLEEIFEEIKSTYSLLTDSQKALLDKNVGGYEIVCGEIADLIEAMKNASDEGKVIQMLTEISLLEKIDTSHGEMIYDAKRAYDLSDKSLIPEELASALDIALEALYRAEDDAAIAENVVTLIDGIGEVDLSSSDKITAAREAYDSLTEEQKYYVRNYSLLTDAEERFLYLTDSKEKAGEVDDLIGLIGEVAAEKEEMILSALVAYEALDDVAKGYVCSYDVLLSAKSTLDDIKAAAEIDKLILSVGEVDITKKELIYLIRDKYDILTDDQKALVENYDVLLSAEEVLTDHVRARKVSKLISKLPDRATFTKDVSIHAAKKEYDALTDDQKALVEGSEKLMKVYSQMVEMEKKVKEYLDEYSSNVLYIEDTTGYVNVTATIEDFLTDKDKDLIAGGKIVVYTVTVMAEEFSYEEINPLLLPVDPEEVPFSPFYYIFISRSIAEMSDGGVISETEERAVKEIPGELTVEIVISEDMMPPVTDITRIFTGLMSPAGDMGSFARIIDLDGNMNTITFKTNMSVSIIPSFIDIINPMTGDDVSVYYIFALFTVVLAGVMVLRKRVLEK
ncbi:MAG: hypothetical protein IKM61_03930 [Eubacteriaceae bacterium]|nr:hypothetical protein [Eubacteriaceae bacterium]